MGTRIVLHLLDAAQSGHTRLMVRTTDTDLVVLVVSQRNIVPATFGVGKYFIYIAAHEIARQLGTPKSEALPMFHAFTGCDVVSFFSGKTKVHKMPKSLPNNDNRIHAINRSSFTSIRGEFTRRSKGLLLYCITAQTKVIL